MFDTDESAPDFIVAAFKNWLTEYIDGGATFSDGQTMQYGYALLTCRVQSRSMRLLAPDFLSMPIEWTDDLAPALAIIASHKYVPQTFGFTPNIPTLRNTAIVGERFDELPMFVNRMSPADSNPNDSGWFIGSERDDVDNNDPERLRVMSLYEATIAVPHVLDFLSLPIGCQVVFNGGRPVVCKEYEALTIPKDSYLDQLLNAK